MKSSLKSVMMKGKVIAIVVLLLIAGAIAWYMLKGKTDTSTDDSAEHTNNPPPKAVAAPVTQVVITGAVTGTDINPATGRPYNEDDPTGGGRIHAYETTHR